MDDKHAWLAGICMVLVFLFICGATVWLYRHRISKVLLYWLRLRAKNKE